MNDFIRYAILPAVGLIIAEIFLRFIVKHVLKNPWKAIWYVLIIVFGLWGIFSAILMSINFYKIPENAVLHKKDIVDIFMYLFSCLTIGFLIVGAGCFFVLRKTMGHDQDRLRLPDTGVADQVKESTEK